MRIKRISSAKNNTQVRTNAIAFRAPAKAPASFNLLARFQAAAQAHEQP
jgi:hypothetical protein